MNTRYKQDRKLSSIRLLCCSFPRNLAMPFFPNYSRHISIFNCIRRVPLSNCKHRVFVQQSRFKLIHPAFKFTPARQKMSHFFLLKGFPVNNLPLLLSQCIFSLLLCVYVTSILYVTNFQWLICHKTRLNHHHMLEKSSQPGSANISHCEEQDYSNLFKDVDQTSKSFTSSKKSANVIQFHHCPLDIMFTSF